jgi:Uncharacterized protein conserved in bacteria
LQTFKYRIGPFEAWRQYALRSFVLVAVLALSLATASRAAALYILTGGSDSAIVLDGSAESTQAVQDFSSKLICVTGNSSGYTLSLTAGQAVTVTHDGATASTAALAGETVSGLLSRMHVTADDDEMIGVDVSGTAVALNVTSNLTYRDTVVEPVSHQTLRVASADLPAGTEQVTQQGSDGVRTAVYEVTYSDGKLASRDLVAADGDTSVDEIVACGTAVSSVSSSDRIASVSANAAGGGVLTFKSGGTMKYSSVRSMTATAYTSGYGGADNITATGTCVGVGTVAVDPSVIPLGTKMYIVTSNGRVVYGVAVAEDTGVRGNRLDLYYDSYQKCISFGRRTCTVYILGK